MLCILTLDSPPLLLGRCLCLGGRYAKVMPPEVSSRFLEATVNGLQENQPPCIRISAVKAIYWFCEASTEKDFLVNIIRCHMPNIFQGLFNLVSQPNTDVLTLVMETFQMLVWVILTLLNFYLQYSSKFFVQYCLNYSNFICVYSNIKNLQRQWKTRFVL